MEQLRDRIGWDGVDWARVFQPDTPLLETFVRGSATYLVLFVLLRTALKRETGGVAIPDLLVIVLLAEAAQNALADDYASIPDGALLIGTIICWDYALNWLGYRFPRVQALVHPRALPLVEDGKPIHRNPRQELLTVDELMGLLRLQGSTT